MNAHPIGPEVVLATSNPHKVEEMRAILGERLPGLRLLGLKDVVGIELQEPEETGSTFEANATIKATSYACQTGRLCLADDSGLEIDALNGRPGVISSHYCTDGREEGMTRTQRDAANNERVLRELNALPPEKRSARFVCVMVLADSKGVRAAVRGTFEGRIGLPGQVPKGNNGFGYDPLFLVGPDFTRTSAELSPEVKNALSHRGAAAALMAGQLKAARL